MQKPQEPRLPGADLREKSCKTIVPQDSAPPQPDTLEAQPSLGCLPSQGVEGSALQPVSKTLYRYVSANRSVDQTSTKRWRRRMRQMWFQLFKPEPWSYEGFDFEPADNGFVTALGSDGKYYYLHERDLKPEVFAESPLSGEVAE